MTVDCELISMHLPPSQSLYCADTENDNGGFHRRVYTTLTPRMTMGVFIAEFILR